jgi:hypothetical protein
MVLFVMLQQNNKTKQIPWPEYTIERPSLVGEVSANFLQVEGIVWSVQRIPTAVISVF